MYQFGDQAMFGIGAGLAAPRTSRGMMFLLTLPDLAEEDVLLARARRGDQAAITAIYESYFEAVYQFIRLRVNDAALAEDIAADVFVRMVAAFRDHRAPRQSLRGWLFRVARNILADHYGRQERYTEIELDEWLPDAGDLEAEVGASLRAERIRHAIQSLPREQQEVLVLRFGQMLSLEETADLMGKRVGAIKSLQFRATSKLRDLMVQVEGYSLQ